MAASDHLGPQFHSTPYPSGFPHDDWSHVGTRKAAEDRAANIRPEEFGQPEDAATIHTVSLRGHVYPHVISDEEANEIGAGGRRPLMDLTEHGWPSGEGYHVFPYLNEGEDPGSVSYLAHRSAIRVVRSEKFGRG